MKRLILAALVTAVVFPLIAGELPATQQQNDEWVAKIRKAIAGRETEPAEQVFKDVRWLKGMPASQLLNVMNLGYSRALGVTCTHCHVATDFASDEKREKRAAREMQALHRAINDQLRTLENLESDATRRLINCRTCHRGHPHPRDAE